MLPSSVKQTLWSYDTDKIDKTKDKRLIISQVLNFGSKDATDWAINNYGKKIIKTVAMSIPKGQWGKKSLNYWSLILGFDQNQIKPRFN